MYLSSDSDEEFCKKNKPRSNHNSQCKKKCSRCGFECCSINCENVRTKDLSVSGCFFFQGEQADPEAIRLPIIMTSTIMGQVPTHNDINNFMNNFMTNPPLVFPPPSQIPQGTFNFDGTPFFGSRLPNFVAILESQNCGMIDSWRTTKEIESKIYLLNTSSTTNYNVCWVLIMFSYNGYQTRVEILDIDTRTMRPGDYGTYRVNWKRGMSILPIQSDAIQVVIQTSVMLVNTTFNSVALNDIQTFFFKSQSLKQNILLTY